MLASRTSQSFVSSLTNTITNSLTNFSLNTETNPHTLDLNMSDTFYVTPINEIEKLDDWNKPLALQAAHHHESLNVPDVIEVEWRLRDRVMMNESICDFILFVFKDENRKCRTCYVSSHWCRST